LNFKAKIAEIKINSISIAHTAESSATFYVMTVFSRSYPRLVPIWYGRNLKLVLLSYLSFYKLESAPSSPQL
jgi:hypothetical protein